jgi:hypothetical protein
MMIFAFDHVRQSGEGDYAFRPNAAEPPTGRSFVSLLTAFAMMTPERYAVRSVAACIAADSPFVYPIELEFHFPDSYAPDDTSVVSGVSADVLSAVRRGRAVILFFFGHEARDLSLPADPQRSIFDLVAGFAEQHDLPAERVWFQDGNLNGLDGFVAWTGGRQPAFQYRPVDFCAALARAFYRLQERGLELKGEIDRDTWMTRLRLVPSAVPLAARYNTPARIRAELADGRLRSRSFLNLNNQPRLHRQLLVSWLHADGLLPRGHVSFPRMSRDLNGAESWPDHLQTDRDAWFSLCEQLPLTVDIGDPFQSIWEENRNQFFIQPRLYPYDDSYFNITSETFFFADRLRFLSEKTFKSLIYLQPMILIGNAGSLDYLQKIGFRTFSPVVDERYDQIADHLERLHIAYSEVKRLAGMSPSAVRDSFSELLPVLEHNFEHLLNGRFGFEGAMDEIEAQL